MKAQIRYSLDGLVPAVVQDFTSRDVLMVAYMNAQALDLTLQTGEMHYWSRSRSKIWHKGESSGNVQRLREFRIDCDGDCLLFLVDQKAAACHDGYRTCFYRRVDQNLDTEVLEARVFDPSQVYKGGS